MNKLAYISIAACVREDTRWDAIDNQNKVSCVNILKIIMNF
jgi:hypothetical protein